MPQGLGVQLDLVDRSVSGDQWARLVRPDSKEKLDRKEKWDQLVHPVFWYALFIIF